MRAVDTYCHARVPPPTHLLFAPAYTCDRHLLARYRTCRHRLFTTAITLFARFWMLSGTYAGILFHSSLTAVRTYRHATTGRTCQALRQRTGGCWSQALYAGRIPPFFCPRRLHTPQASGLERALNLPDAADAHAVAWRLLAAPSVWLPTPHAFMRPARPRTVRAGITGRQARAYSGVLCLPAYIPPVSHRALPTPHPTPPPAPPHPHRRRCVAAGPA